MKFSYRNGTTSYEVLSSILAFLLGYYFLFSLFSLFSHKLSFWKKAFFEFVICVLQVVLVFNNPVYSYVLNVVFVAVSLVMNLFARKLSISSNSPVHGSLHDPRKKTRDPAISIYRTAIMVMTTFSIFACDFSIFPRRFMKTRTYGYSMMDVGVGAFVFSAGLVSKNSFKRNRKLALMHRITSVFQNQLILLFLGIFRYVLLNSISYAYDIKEYGTFWNFYFTLASVHLAAEIIDFAAKDIRWLGLLMIAIYELILKTTNLSKYIFHAKRTSFFSSNREGIVSIVGYTAIFMMGKDFGGLLKVKKNKNKTLFLTASAFSTVYFVYCVLCEFMVSRRLVNLGYFLWICMINMCGICVFEILRLIFKYELKDIVLSECINCYGLGVFLLANFITLTVNHTMHPRDFSPIVSYAIHVFYMGVLCAIPLYLAKNKLFSGYSKPN